MDEIQRAQVEAAENVVVEGLRKKGLLPPESPRPAEPAALNITDLLPATEDGQVCECRCHGYHEVRAASCRHCEPQAIKAAKEIVDKALAPHPLGMELLVNCAECGSLLNAEICNGFNDPGPFGKQILITVARCGCRKEGE